VPGIPDRPDLVIAIPFYWKPNEDGVEQMRVMIMAEAGGHWGLFMLDLGSPNLQLNHNFLRPSLSGGVDTWGALGIRRWNRSKRSSTIA
jgi:hypothetical protein